MTGMPVSDISASSCVRAPIVTIDSDGRLNSLIPTRPLIEYAPPTARMAYLLRERCEVLQ